VTIFWIINADDRPSGATDNDRFGEFGQYVRNKDCHTPVVEWTHIGADAVNETQKLGKQNGRRRKKLVDRQVVHRQIQGGAQKVRLTGSRQDQMGCKKQ
jgi:hypothetical protein